MRNFRKIFGFLERYINYIPFGLLCRRRLVGRAVEKITESRKLPSERTSRFEFTLLEKAWAKKKNENPGVGVIIMEIK